MGFPIPVRCHLYIESGPWMTANMLQLNMDKTDVLIVLMNKSLRNPIAMNKIKMDSIDLSTASSVRNLGAIFDSALRSEAFVNSKILIQAYVMSKIDYCNSLYGIPDKLLNRIREFRTMLLGWSSGCINSYHISTGHTTLAPCQSPDRFPDRIAGLQSPKWSSPSP